MVPASRSSEAVDERDDVGRSSGAGYFEWHGEPGYFRDITRHIPVSGAVLDVGCGTGWLANHVTDYTGIDSARDAVEAAQALGRNVVLGDLAEALPFADETFACVVVKDVLEHVADPAALVAEVWRVLAPRGVVFASAPDAQRWVWNDYTHLRPYSRTAMRRLFADHRFCVRTVGYEAVVPGTSHLSARTRRKRRPRVVQLAAWLPFVRRNVWIVAER